MQEVYMENDYNLRLLSFKGIPFLAENSKKKLKKVIIKEW